jgi:hypothetical protein
MKRFALLNALIMPLFVVAGFIVNSTTKTNEPAVTFYKTPLVCNAAPDIGCGSRSKPILLELEKNPAIKEAWLNRSGTVIAIVWKYKAQTETVAKPIFKKNDISFSVLNQQEAIPFRKTFRQESLWYHGAAVDMLSQEEATRIAESAVKYAIQTKLITTDEAEKIKTDVEAYFKVELVKLRNNEQLNEDNQHKFRDALYGIDEKYIGKERTDKAMELYQKNCEKQCKKDAACTTPGSKKGCCNK